MDDFDDQAVAILTSPASREQKARALAELVREERNFHWVGLYDVSATHISAIAWTGDRPPAFPIFPVSQGINGAAVSGRRSVVVQDVSRDPHYLTTFGATRSEAIFPVLSESGAVVGTLDVESNRVNAFTSEDESFLARCATALAPLWQPEQGTSPNHR
jgi:L-methionine (R)-S-oxide reductase